MAKNEKPEGYVFGRPTKYRPEMCSTVVELMSQGASKLEVCGALGVFDQETLIEWEKKYPDFSEAIKTGVQQSEIWWQRKGRQNVDNKEFNTALWYINMKNRFGWRDKKETTSTITLVQQEDALKKLE